MRRSSARSACGPVAAQPLRPCQFLRLHLIEARVDLAAGKLISFEEMKDVQAPFLASEMFGVDEVIKKDRRVSDALKRRGFSDFKHGAMRGAPTPVCGHS
jgi:Cu2+-containing amine oxidase